MSSQDPRSTLLLEFVGAWIGLACLTALVSWLAFHVHQVDADGLDHRLLRWAIETRAEHPWMTWIARFLTRLGDDIWAHALVLGVAGMLWRLQIEGKRGVRRGEAAFFLGVTLVGTISGSILKRIVDRPRPDVTFRMVEETTSSFPSGHSVLAGVVSSMLIILLVWVLKGIPLWTRVIGVFLCLAVGVGIAASRVWLGVHYPSDVVGGLALGTAWVLAAWLIRLHGLDFVRRRNARRGSELSA